MRPGSTLRATHPPSAGATGRRISGLTTPSGLLSATSARRKSACIVRFALSEVSVDSAERCVTAAGHRPSGPAERSMCVVHKTAPRSPNGPFSQMTHAARAGRPHTGPGARGGLDDPLDDFVDAARVGGPGLRRPPRTRQTAMRGADVANLAGPSLSWTAIGRSGSSTCRGAGAADERAARHAARCGPRLDSRPRAGPRRRQAQHPGTRWCLAGQVGEGGTVIRTPYLEWADVPPRHDDRAVTSGRRAGRQRPRDSPRTRTGSASAERWGSSAC